MSTQAELELVHDCYLDAFRVLATCSGGSKVELPGGLMVSCGIPYPGMNPAFLPPGAGEPDVRAAIEHFEGLGLPCSIRFQGEPGPEADAALRAAGFEPASSPAMLAEAAAVAGNARPADLVVRTVRSGADEAAFGATAGAGFGMAPDHVVAAIPGSSVSSAVEMFVGWVRDEPVSTSMAVLHPGAVGIYCVATPSEHRRRGFAEAMTAAAVAWGNARGRTLATLQSSPMGLRIYSRLGFRTIVSYAVYSRPKS